MHRRCERTVRVASLVALVLALCAPSASRPEDGEVAGRAAPAGAATGGSDVGTSAQLEVFTRSGCPRCAAAERFIDELRDARPDLIVMHHDVGADARARERLEALAAREGIGAVGVPAFAVHNRLVVGFEGSETTGRRLVELLERAPEPARSGAPASEAVCPGIDGVPCPSDEQAGGAIDLPFIGTARAGDLGLPAFTVAVGLVDGFNPCATWLLLFLLSLLVNLHDRRKMLVVAITFVVVSGIVYFAFMAAWLNAFLLLGYTRATELVLGAIAIVFGLVNVKDFVAFRRGVALTIPETAKPGIYARVRRVIHAESLWAALLAVAVLAVLVNAVELLCTAGLPALYTRILTLHALPGWQYYAYLGLYNLAYVLDDAIMVALAVTTLRRFKLTERGGQWLKLLSGAVMVLLGIALILTPAWLGPGQSAPPR